MTDTRPLSERLISAADECAKDAPLLREAAALAARVEAAPTSHVTQAHVGHRVGKVRNFVPQGLIGKRVALVEVPNA